MAKESGISWCDATFNGWWGCWPVSPGCALCYAAREAERYGWREDGGSGPDLWQRQGPRRTFGEAHWSGKNSPLAWAKSLPQDLGRRPRVFCSSMSDIGENHPVAAAERPRLFRLIEETPELDWLLLTKRVATAREWLPQSWLHGRFPEHVWFGFSAEDDLRYRERAPRALEVGARITFCSYEPALGGIRFNLNRFPLSWVVGGGESAIPQSRARPMHPRWMRDARDECAGAGVAFHFKQWGEWAPLPAIDPKVQASRVHTFPDGTRVALLGRKLAGRMLDGRTWDEFPA